MHASTKHTRTRALHDMHVPADDAPLLLHPAHLPLPSAAVPLLHVAAPRLLHPALPSAAPLLLQPTQLPLPSSAAMLLVELLLGSSAHAMLLRQIAAAVLQSVAP
jgi:hypothetical protein